MTFKKKGKEKKWKKAFTYWEKEKMVSTNSELVDLVLSATLLTPP